MYCGKCGSHIPEGNSFCANCGIPIINGSDQSSAQTFTQQIQPVPVILAAQPTPIKKTNGVAIAGLVLGIVTICLCWIPYVGLALGILGFILSIIGICMISACRSGSGPAITGLILSIIGLLVGSFMTIGMNAYLKKAQTAYDKEMSVKTNIETSTQYLGNIKYEAPSSWSYEESGIYKYFYPDNNNADVFMMVFSEETDVIYPTDDVFDAFLDGLVGGLSSNGDLQSLRIVSREAEKKDDFYIGKVNVKAITEGAYREFLFYVVLDCKTGTCYGFLFTQPDNISEENKSAFDFVTNSIELR